jgi:hypothetical protein
MVLYDPDGRMSKPAIGAIIGGLVGFAVATDQEIQRAMSVGVTIPGSSQRILGGIVGGALAGAVGGSCGGCKSLVARLAVGSAGSVGGGVVNRLLSGTDQSFSESGRDAVYGVAGTAGGELVGAGASALARSSLDE